MPYSLTASSTGTFIQHPFDQFTTSSIKKPSRNSTCVNHTSEFQQFQKFRQELQESRQARAHSPNRASSASIASSTSGASNSIPMQQLGAAITSIKQTSQPATPQSVIAANLHPPAEHAIQRLALALSAAPTATENADSNESHGGMLAVDLDELIHGAYTAVMYGIKASNAGVQGIYQTLQEDADLLAKAPLDWLRDSALPHNSADLPVTAGVSALLLPLAVVALVAGIKEMRESKQHGKTLHAATEKLRIAQDNLNDILARSDPNPFSTARQLLSTTQLIYSQQLADLKQMQQRNKENGRIGFCSALSGGAIALKSSLDTGSKVTATALGASSATAGVVATVAGVGGAVVGLAAAAGAIGLGVNMVQKSDRVAKQFKAASSSAIEHMQTRDQSQQVETEQYRDFVTQKLGQREKFFTSFAKGNRWFLGGSTLYGAGTVVSAGLTIAAVIAGVSLGPIGLAVVIGVGIIGGAVMGINSKQFLRGHPKQHRYEDYVLKDDPELDRRFLATLDTYAKTQPSIAADLGLRMRAHFYKQASRREELRQDFLSTVAKNQSRRYHGSYSYSTDPKEIQEKRPPARKAWGHICDYAWKKREIASGRWQVMTQYVDSRFHGRSHSLAKTDANEWRQSKQTYLSPSSLRHWLSQSENYPQQIQLMQDSLHAQIDYLEAKNKSRNNLFALNHSLNSGALEASINGVDLSIPAGVNPLDDLIDPIVKQMVSDQRILNQAKELQAQLVTYADAVNNLAPDALAESIDHFLTLQQGQVNTDSAPAPSLVESHQKLAHHYLKEAPGRYRDARGILLETELEADRLRLRAA